MEYTEKEKKAINVLKYLLKRRYEDEIETYDLFVSIETTLNLLEKQQKEIEKKEQRLIITREAYNRVVLEVVDLEENSIPKEAIRERIEKIKPIVEKYEKQMENDEETELSYEEASKYGCALKVYQSLLGE